MKTYRPQDFEAIVATPSIWVVENLFRLNRKRVSLICGSPHAGKSTLARQLVIAIAQGLDFLGRTTMKSSVIYWQSEESEEAAKEDFQKSGMKLGDGIIVLHPEPKDNNLTELSKALDENPDVRLVVIETLDDFLQMPDLSDNPVARRAFEQFDAEVVSKHRNRCAFVVLHHFKKSDEQKGLSLNKILGATVIAGKTDAKVYMHQAGENDPRRILSVQIRKGTSIEPTYLDFNEATQSSTLGQTVASVKAEDKKVTVSQKQDELRQRCLTSVASHPNEWPQRKHVTEVGGKTQAANDTFRALIDNGKGVIGVDAEGFLYVKGKKHVKSTEDSTATESVPEYHVCADDNCTTSVEHAGDFCPRHKPNVVPAVPDVLGAADVPVTPVTPIDMESSKGEVWTN